MKKTLLGVLITVVLVWLIHGMLLIKISKLEIAINNNKRELETVEKELNAKIMEYDSKIDLDKVGKEMTTKKKMKIANNTDFHFFEIEN